MIEIYRGIGKRHWKAGQENQDAVAFREKGPVSVIALADGVSACKWSGQGAVCCADAAASLLLQKGNILLDADQKESADFITSHVVYRQRLLARSQKHPETEYASTLAAVFCDRRAQKLFYCSLGDSLILTVRQGECQIPLLPPDSSEGCCVTMTEHAERGMRTGVMDLSGMEAVFLFSDGAWTFLFEEGNLKADVRTMIGNRWYGDLRDYLKSQNGQDDCSFISIDLCNMVRRKAA